MPDGRRLILVVGPSGAGKDSIIAGARKALTAVPTVIFPRRVITRPSDTTGGEDHEPCDDASFERHAAEGAFALHWHANGLFYGVPVSMDAALLAGSAVVLNVSRAVVGEAERRYPGLCVCIVTAATALRAQRLAARGREAPLQIAQRLDRSDTIAVAAGDVREIRNDGALEESVALLVDIIRQRLSYDARPAASA